MFYQLTILNNNNKIQYIKTYYIYLLNLIKKLYNQ